MQAFYNYKYTASWEVKNKVMRYLNELHFSKFSKDSTRNIFFLRKVFAENTCFNNSKFL